MRSRVPQHMSASLLCQSHPLLFCGNLRFHLEDHLCQQPFTVLSGFSVDVAGMLFAVRPDGGIAAFPQMIIDLSDAPGAWFTAFPFVRLESAGSELLGCGSRLRCGLDLADSMVNLSCRRLPHLVSDMRVDVQRGAAGHMADHRGKGLDIHSVFQRHGGEQVTQVVETDMSAPGPLQNGSQVLADGGGVQGQVIFPR